MTSAIVFVLSRYLDTDGAACVAHCSTMGYRIAAVVRDDWAGAMSALAAGIGTVLVVARLDHLPADATPRMEVAAEQPTTENPAAAPGRRTRTLRRNAAR